MSKSPRPTLLLGDEANWSALLSRYKFSVFAAAIGLVATALTVWASISTERQMRFQTLEQELATISDALSESIGTSERAGTFRVMLRAAAGFVDASGFPSDEKWRAFADEFEIESRFPGIQGLGLAVAGSRGKMLSVAQDEVRSGRAGFRPWPDGDRDLYTMIVRLAPDDARNRSALGFDMYSDPRRRRAMQAARDTGQTTYTEVVTLVQQSGGPRQPAGLAYRPIFSGGGIPSTVDERRQKLIGFVYAAFRWGDYITDVLTRTAPRVQDIMHLRIYTQNVQGQDVVLYQTPGATFSGGVQSGALRSSVPVGGEQWTIEAVPTQVWANRFDWLKPLLVLISGLALTGLSAFVMGGLTYSRDVAFREQQRLTAEVEQRRQAQEHVQLANNELIHRVKNTLAIVSAIASQTARTSTTLPGFVSAFRDRLAALSTVHDLLRPDPSFTPNLETFLRDMLKAFAGDVNASQLQIEGPVVVLPRNEAVLLSLLINELATNATKYGSWSTPAGKVRVTWRLEDSEMGDDIILKWVETGGPRYHAPPSGNGFGTKVIEAIERGLRGKIERTFPDGGLNLLFRFPRPRTRVLSHG